MTLLVPTVSEGTMLAAIVNKAAATDIILKLYTNNHAPANGDTAASYTEMTTQGYTAKTLTGASWTVATGSRPATASYAQQTWTANGTGGATTVYGYFAVYTTSGLLAFAELFSDGPYTMTNSGDAISVTPQVTLT